MILPPVFRNKKYGKRKVALLVLFCLFALIFFLPQTVQASAASEEENKAMEELQKNIQDLLDSLDTSELQAYLETLSDWKGGDVKDKLMSVITGDFKLDYSSLAASVFGLVWDECKLMLPAFAVILAVALLCGILNSAKSGFIHSTMSNIINFVGYLSVGAVTIEIGRASCRDRVCLSV